DCPKIICISAIRSSSERDLFHATSFSTFSYRTNEGMFHNQVISDNHIGDADRLVKNALLHGQDTWK
ncbi:hypothetical protein KCX83_16520, partial [Brucella oryzae]|uniref:hypothetical protein n=1 Tax=Brucella oryzae TaxID=335286 RepID=UPI001B830FE7